MPFGKADADDEILLLLSIHIKRNPFSKKIQNESLEWKTWQAKVALSMNKTDWITSNFGHRELLFKFKMDLMSATNCSFEGFSILMASFFLFPISSEQLGLAADLMRHQKSPAKCTSCEIKGYGNARSKYILISQRLWRSSSSNS